MKLFKNQIRKLEDRIRVEHPILRESTLDELQLYRTSQKDSLSNVFNVVCKCAMQVQLLLVESKDLSLLLEN